LLCREAASNLHMLTSVTLFVKVPPALLNRQGLDG
jgi:hypothetical protein